MRRCLSIFLAAVLVMAVSLSAFAQESKGSAMCPEETKGTMMCDDAMMMKCREMAGMCPMREAMKCMMKREVVVTADGGVLILQGNKIVKYDKNLNVVKEVEIKSDMEGMHKMMMKMKENCPMREKMMKHGIEQGTKDKPAESEKTDAAPAHKAHH